MKIKIKRVNNAIPIHTTKRILKKIKFNDIDIEPYRKDFRFNTEEDLKGFLEAAPLVPLLESIPNGFKNTFIDRYMEIYLDKVGYDNYVVNLYAFSLMLKKYSVIVKETRTLSCHLMDLKTK